VNIRIKKILGLPKVEIAAYIDRLEKENQALWNISDNWSLCEDDYTMHDQYENLDERYDIDENDGRIILKELYDYTEEDGYQLKETGDDE
jgi:hypothetical protein